VILFDTSVVIDARDSDSPFHTWATQQIAEAVSTEGAAVDSIVLAEACARARDPERVPKRLRSG
jgi:predicted nucleic acid-binding protein